jgi:hypothetical protein
MRAVLLVEGGHRERNSAAASVGQLRRRDVLGGLIHEYEYAG